MYVGSHANSPPATPVVATRIGHYMFPGSMLIHLLAPRHGRRDKRLGMLDTTNDPYFVRYVRDGVEDFLYFLEPHYREAYRLLPPDRNPDDVARRRESFIRGVLASVTTLGKKCKPTVTGDPSHDYPPGVGPDDVVREATRKAKVLDSDGTAAALVNARMEKV